MNSLLIPAQAFINRLQYQIQQVDVKIKLLKTYPQAYGQLEYVAFLFVAIESVALIALARRFVAYADPVDDTMVPL